MTSKLRISLLCSIALSSFLLPGCVTNDPITKAVSDRSSAAAIKVQSSQALEKLYASDPRAREMGNRAKGVLIFPDIVKAGFIIGGQSGQGTLFLANGQVDYYQTVAASYGLQAGIQKFGYALFLMNDKALRNLYKTEGWEVGSSPGITVVDEGIARSLTSTTIDSGTYALFFNQRGLMAGLTLEGTKITRIIPGR